MQPTVRQQYPPRPIETGGRILCAIALLLWLAALILLALVIENVTYTVCQGTLLQLPPPPVHWPPQGHNLQLIDLQRGTTLAAAGVSILGVFTLLFGRPDLSVMWRTAWLVMTVLGSVLAIVILYLVVQEHVLHANIDALARCL